MNINLHEIVEEFKYKVYNDVYKQMLRDNINDLIDQAICMNAYTISGDEIYVHDGWTEERDPMNIIKFILMDERIQFSCKYYITIDQKRYGLTVNDRYKWDQYGVELCNAEITFEED